MDILSDFLSSPKGQKFEQEVSKLKSLDSIILEKIKKNKSLYIANEGLPIKYIGNATFDSLKFELTTLVKGPLLYSLNDKKRYIYNPGEMEINNLIRNFSLTDSIVQNRPFLFQQMPTEIRGCFLKLGYKFLISYQSKNFEKFYLPALNKLIYNLQISEKDDCDFNQKQQPSLRNALAIIEYFKLVDAETKFNFSSPLDCRFRTILNSIPAKFRNNKL